MSLIVSSIEKACAEILHCPHCQQSFVISGDEIVCISGHSFPLASVGYLNLLQQPVTGFCTEQFIAFNRTIAEERFAALEAALVKTILVITNYKRDLVILDAGCGDGSLFSGILLSLRWEGIQVEAIGVDIAGDAIRHAVNNEQDVIWIIADNSRLPVQDASVDVILNTGCPADYSEFNRVLKRDGWLVKTIYEPGPIDARGRLAVDID